MAIQDTIEAFVKTTTNHALSHTILKKVIIDPKYLRYSDILTYIATVFAAMWTAFNFTQRRPSVKDIVEFLGYIGMAVLQVVYWDYDEPMSGERFALSMGTLIAVLLTISFLLVGAVKLAKGYDSQEGEANKEA